MDKKVGRQDGVQPNRQPGGAGAGLFRLVGGRWRLLLGTSR
jgi:hypothetical protein